MKHFGRSSLFLRVLFGDELIVLLLRTHKVACPILADDLTIMMLRTHKAACSILVATQDNTMWHQEKHHLALQGTLPMLYETNG